MKLEFHHHDLKAFLRAGVAMFVALLLFLGWWFQPLRPKHSLDVDLAKTTPAGAEFGWSGPESLALSKDFIDSCPPFELVDEQGRPVVQDNETARVCQWEYVTKANRGTYPPNLAQQGNDCTGWGAAHAIQNAQAGHLVGRNQIGTFRLINPAALYCGARHWGGYGARYEGCSGAAVAEFAQKFGVLPADEPGVALYSAELLRDWDRRGPPEHLRAVMAKHKVKTVAQAKTTRDAWDAICNRFGVTIASDAGFNRFQRRDGRIVGIRLGVWRHQMAIDGVDGSIPGQRYYHVQNSWGENKHPAPIDGSPAGGFWIGEEDMAYIIGCGDSWIYSDFEGFPAAKIEFSLTRAKSPRLAPTAHMAPSKQVGTESQPTPSRKDSNHVSLHQAL
ncbi:MAG: hypothetical protein ACKV2Q_24800 [Planctomycetaceae bacterium]